jgi:hypothetical protein
MAAIHPMIAGGERKHPSRLPDLIMITSDKAQTMTITIRTTAAETTQQHNPKSVSIHPNPRLLPLYPIAWNPTPDSHSPASPAIQTPSIRNINLMCASITPTGHNRPTIRSHISHPKHDKPSEPIHEQSGKTHQFDSR